MDKKLWQKAYSSFPRFVCPNCKKGTLFRKADTFKLVEPQHITNDLANDDLVGEVSHGRFVGFLVCSNRFCGEHVAVGGDYRTDYHHQYDHDLEQDVSFETTIYYPYSMRPAPQIIEPPKMLNHDCRLHLYRAYELLWADAASCANRLRIVVEFLLDQLEIPRIGAKGKRKKVRLDLGDRIELLKAVKPGHEDALNALRYVGNTGSHDGVVDFDDVIDCFDFLEEAMVELLEDRRAKRAQRMQEIIAAKGKPQG